MKKLILAVLALGLFGMGVAGCHAEGGVDTRGASSVGAFR